MLDVITRSYSTGPELSEAGVHFRVWAPQADRISIVLNKNTASPIPLVREDDGYFSAIVPEANSGSLYQFLIDDEQKLYPDPASRFQPEGPHGPSQVVDSKSFQWTDQSWKGVSLRGQVIYEMHVGTFTREGTWSSAEKQLSELKDFGITLIEVMPVAEFPGDFGWGYDGVDLYAPVHIYGTPDDFRSFVNAAHKNGIGVILDVVYNHFGPDGNYISNFAASFFADKETDWGTAINYDGKDSEHVRQFMMDNAAYWISEFHLDGLRLDATQDIHDSSKDHIIAAITRSARKAAGDRKIVIIAENEPQDPQLIRSPDEGGYGVDALWNDDFHHSAMVAMTGKNEAYYTDYFGKPQEFISSIKYGYLYQGQWYKWQEKRRGKPSLAESPERFVTYIQNHDQVANSGQGKRVHLLTSPGRFRAMSALFLLAPGTPMIFQGQEFGASSPFLYFADHNNELGEKVYKGRAEFLAQFRSLKTPEAQSHLHNPCSRETFELTKLDFTEREKHADIYSMYRDLLTIRRNDPVFAAQGLPKIDGAVLADEAFVIRFFSDDHGDRLLIVNLGIDLHLNPAPEPLLAPVEDTRWELLWSSEDPRYGGTGTPAPESEENWRIPAHAAIVMKSAGLEEPDARKHQS